MTTRALSALLAFGTVCAVVACGRPAVERTLDDEALYGKAFTGWAVVDLATGERLTSRHPDRLFTPASNTKVLTLATALAYLPADSLPALAYRYDGDTLRLWGTAYPYLAAEPTEADERIRRRLAAHAGPVEVSVHGFASLPRFGSGWMWDDYGGTYARERSGLPVYANLARAWRDPAGGWRAVPDFLAVNASEVLPKGRLSRKEASNRFEASAKTSFGDTLRAPLYGAQDMTAQLLEEWVGRPVVYHAEPLPSDWRSRTLPGQPRDTLLRAMMLPSDNFLAEQLFLQAGLVGADLTDERATRTTVKERGVLGVDLEALRWEDASGLSHYNLISPSAAVSVLAKVYADHDWSLVRRLFATGGEPNSTLSRSYLPKPGEPAWLWAKTGTLRHNHCLMGYLRADSGRMLAFSFMHNHFPGESQAYKKAMERSLRALKSTY